MNVAVDDMYTILYYCTCILCCNTYEYHTLLMEKYNIAIKQFC